MKKAFRIISVILSVLMIAGCILPLAGASVLVNEEKDTVTIFVDGINSENLISTETGEAVFPPSADTIVSAVMSAAPAVIKSLATKDWSYTEQPLVDAVYGIFHPISCDENGKPYSDVGFDWEWPSEKEVKEKLESESYGVQLKYAFDWRLDMKTIATDLHDFIEYVMDIAGVSKVNLIGFSMGTCAVMSYLKLFDYEYVNGVVLLSGGYNGASICGQPFSGHVNLDADAIVRFVDCMVDSSLLNALLAALNKMGVIDAVCDLGNGLTAELSDAVYSQVFTKTFATMPGLWALVPAEYYEEAMEMIGTSLSDTTREMIAWYHDEVQANNEEIINGCLDRGINFGIIARYGYSGIPAMEATENQGDGMIDTKYESFGATCAPVNSTLGEGYTQQKDVGFDCVSPDNIIDASTCVYPQYTWFIKNSYHTATYTAMMKIAHSILDADEQVTVLTGEYSQFLYCTDEETAVALTAENDPGAIYSENIGNESTMSILKQFNTGTKELIADMFRKIIDRFKGLFSTAVC